MKNLRKLISLCLTLCILLSLVPVGALAEETEQAPISGELTWVSEEDMDSEELYEGYALQQFCGGTSYFGTAAGERLSGDEKAMYDALVPIIRQIADGNRASATITIGQGSSVDSNAVFTGSDLSEGALAKVLDALMSDLPYECYWYDKTTGCKLSYSGWDTITSMTFYFTVGVKYRGADQYTADTTKTGSAKLAADNAKSILSKYAGASDYEKLIGYRDEICALVSYDDTAADTSNYYKVDLNPWQLINVFDGKASTNVVCEGYSKAFMYLCDMTEFSGDINCHTVTGYMNGGGHMWNIVDIEGKHYLADITNSDTGTSGSNGSLFLAGGTGTPAGGYTVSGIQYAYKTDMIELWGTADDSLLAIEAEGYDPDAGSVEHVHEYGEDHKCECGAIGGTCGENLTWSLTDDGLLTILGSGNMTDYNFEPIPTGDAPWHTYHESIKTVIINEGVASIGNNAFGACTNLTNVTIPNSVIVIGDEAFRHCYALNSITLPDSISSIGSYAFHDCTALTNVTIPDNVTAIGEYTFSNCLKLESISIGANVASIDSRAFLDCSMLATIKFYGNAPSFCDNCFNGVTATAYYPANNSTWTSDVMQNYGGTITWTPKGPDGEAAGTHGDNVTWMFDENTGTLTIMGTGAIQEESSGSRMPWYPYCDQITAIVVENGITEIPYYTFEYLENVKTISLPDTLESLTLNAFNDCGNLNNLILPASLKTISGSSNAGHPNFIRCESLTDVYYMGTEAEWLEIPEAQYVKNADANMTMHFLVLQEDPASCTETGTQSYYTFDDTSVYSDKYDLNKNVITTLEEIPALGHKWDAGTVTKEPTETQTGIRTYTCTVCSGTKTEKIDVLVHTHSYDTETVTPPTCIAQGYTTHTCACGDSYMDSYTDATGVHSYVDSVCEHCGAIGGTCGKNLTWTFDSATGAFEISGIGDIPAYYDGAVPPWYDYRTNITKVVVGEGITEIGMLTFSGCTNLISMELPESLTWISEAAFSGCSSLLSVEIPENVTVIGDYAFQNCSGLQSVVIPDSVTNIYTSAFNSCSNLKNITFEGDAPSIHNSAFSFVSATAYYPANNPTWTEDVMQDYGGDITWICEACRNGHSWDDGTVTKEPTEEETGIRTYTCTVCGKTRTEDIDKAVHSHSYTRAVVEPTCSEQGYTTYICSCGDSYNESYTDALGHNYEDGVCTRCKEADPYSGTCGENLTWTLDEEGTLTISGTGTMTDYYYDAPWNCGDVKAVIVKNGVTSIGDCSFANCTNMAEITIPDSVTRIGAAAIQYCASLTELVIPNSVTSVGEVAFCGNGGLTSVTIPNNGIELGSNAFAECTGLTSITILGNADISGQFVFRDCTGLKKIIFEGDAPTFGSSTFSGVTAIANYPANNSTWTEEIMQNYGGNITWKPDCGGNHSLVILPAVEATCQTTGLTDGVSCEVCGFVSRAQEVVPVSDHKYNAQNVCRFCGITGGNCGAQVTNVKWSLDTKGTLTIYGTGDMSGVDSSMYAPWSAHRDRITTVVVEEGVETIGSNMLGLLPNLKSVTLPQSLLHISKGAFHTTPSLKSIYLHDGIQTIGNSAFQNGGLTEVTLPENTKIGAYVFDNCTALKKVTMNTALDSGANGSCLFRDCTALEEVVLGDKVNWISQFMFSGCTALERIVIPGSAKLIAGNAFDGCTALEEVLMESGVEHIGPDAFARCTALKEITFPDSITELEEAVFNYCENLDQIWFTGDAPVIDSSAFSTLKVTAYYPGNNATWTKDARGYYGSTLIKWVPFNHAHSYTATVVSPTCTKKGYTVHLCACGNSYIDSYVNPTGNHTYSGSTDTTCDVCGAEREEVVVKTVPMFRMYDPNSGEHFYSGSELERQFLVDAGWHYEGVGFNFPEEGAPVHRLYDPVYGEHLYTMDEAEMNRLLAKGWNYENVAFNSAGTDEVPQYRLHNPNAKRGAYHFTGSTEERDLLISFGWEYQGIGWYSSLE